MTKLHETIETSLDREAAFAYISDWSRQAEWDPNTVSAARIGEGGPELGARYALEVKGFRSPVSMEYRITELVAPERLVLIGESSYVWTEDVLTFSETETGTRVDYHAEIKLNGVLKLAEPFMGRYFDGIGEGVKVGMKRELDARA
ncbi:MAG: SRPBCC family protein [Candidatus Limnocylindrales bacterium]